MAVVVMKAAQAPRDGRVPQDGRSLRDEPPPGATQETGTAAAASEESTSRPDWAWYAIGLVLLVAGVSLGYVLHNITKVTFALPPGVSEFALFYILAQSIERIGEFLSYIPYVGVRLSGATIKRQGTEALTKPNATRLRDAAKAASMERLAKGEDATDQVQATANAQEDIQVIRANRAIFFLGLNTAIAAIACGYFKLLILQTFGVSGAWNWLDIGVTALAIGGGTKPLHDLITNVQKAKEEKEDSPTTTG